MAASLREAQARDDHPLLRGLNPEQREAVLHDHGAMLVLAGAGSGKTRVITHRIAWLVRERGVPPWQILAVTFSNKAAGEMRHRLQELLGPDANSLWLGTFHAIGVRLLRQIGAHAGIGTSFTIYDRDDHLKMVGRVLRQLNLSDKVHPPRKFAAWIDSAKNRCLLPGDPALAATTREDKLALQVYQAYEVEMRRAGAVDFGDLLLRPVQILREQPALASHWAARFAHILVDEFQDTNGAQVALLDLLASIHHNLTVVGDDDQSIYSWRGAEIENILQFPDLHPGCRVVRLERNYRSTDVILAASGAIVRQNRRRHDKTLWTDRTGGDKVTLHVAASDRDEADWVARGCERAIGEGVEPREIAVFYRTNAQSRVLEESMSRFRVPYIVVGGLRFYERAEIKDLLAYCRLLLNPSDTASFLRAVNTPARGIGDRTIEIIDAAAAAEGVPLPEAARRLVARGEGGRSRDKLAAFVALIDRMRASVAGLRADEAGLIVLRDSGLRDALIAEGSDEAQTRLENLGALVSAMAEYAADAEDPSLQGYLETVALVSDIDSLKAGGRYVSLMTMHAAKGLEYDVTYVCGLEEELVPHAMADVDEDEERRLLYVAMSRARKKMHLSWARQRMRFGNLTFCEPSRFLRALPEAQIERSGEQDRRGVGGFGARPSYASAAAPLDRAPRWGATPYPAAASPARWVPPAMATSALGAAAARPPGGARAGDDAEAEAVVEREVEGPFRVGGQARHAQFGLGTVLAVDGYGPMARISVQFPRAGLKKVVARFLQPR